MWNTWTTVNLFASDRRNHKICGLYKPEFSVCCLMHNNLKKINHKYVSCNGLLYMLEIDGNFFYGPTYQSQISLLQQQRSNTEISNRNKQGSKQNSSVCKARAGVSSTPGVILTQARHSDTPLSSFLPGQVSRL